MKGVQFRQWRVEWVVWALILAYIAFFGPLTVQKHKAFQTTAFDLGNVDQALWNTRHGRPLAMTNIEGLTNRLGTHVEPILLLISLLYFVWSDPGVLLLFQTIVIALGAWCVFLITRHAVRNTQDATRTTYHALPLVLVLTYLLFPALQSANVFDFHAVALAPTFFLFAFYCLETERWGGFALFVVLTMGCKEDMPLLVAMLGLYALVVRRRWRVGLTTIAVAGIWFLLATAWMMPHFDTRDVSPLANRYAYLGNGPLEMAVTTVTRPGVLLNHLLVPENLAYVRDLLTPVAFLSLLAPEVLVLAVPPLAVNLLSTDDFMHQLEGFHYAAILAPIVVVSAVFGVIRLSSPQASWLRRRFPGYRHLPLLFAMIVLVATLLYHRGHGYTPLADDFGGSWPRATDHHRLGEDIARSIPPEASVAALPHPNPHASQRQLLYMIDRVENGLPAPLHDADYVWLDVTDSWPLHPNDLKTGVQYLLAEGYGIDQAVDGWLLLQRGALDRTLPDAFYSFARRQDPRMEYATIVEFGDVLRLLGFDVVQEGDMTSLSLYWETLEPLDSDYRIYPFFYDDAGRIVEDTTLRPMTTAIWYPTSKWQTGETVLMQTLPWDAGGDFNIGLGVIDGWDWQLKAQRLPARVTTSTLRVRLFDQDTAVELAEVRGGEITTPRRILSLPPTANPLNVNLDSQIDLLGYSVEPASPSVRDTIHLTLYWRARVDVDSDYTVFAHLVDPRESIVAQHDGQPDAGRYPTSQWLEGEIVEDEHALVTTPDYQPGEYRLVAGLYFWESGERLPAYAQNGVRLPQSRIVLTTVQVRE